MELQSKLSKLEYILIDEYSMLGQNTFGWIDRRCRQATGRQSQIFGGKSIILIGDPAQLPPVADKPLYHAKPSNAVGKQRYFAYQMFERVVTLTVNQRVKESNHEQTVFRDLPLRLRNGESTKHDCELLLARQPSHIANLELFKHATHLYYSNEEVSKYNYEKLIQLEQPIAQINARHSTAKARTISPQEMYGLQPTLLLAKGARVMLTMNLWQSVYFCNGSTGRVLDIIYHNDHRPPDLPIAVIVKFDNYVGPSISEVPAAVPIVPVSISVNSVHERQQLPLRLSWAMTIHKSQGLTLPKAWIDLGKSKATLSMSYVAISRVRNLSALVIEQITFDRLSKIKNCANLKYRTVEE